MLLLVIACNAGPWSPTLPNPRDTQDTQALADPVPLDPYPSWQSTERGVATGMAFADMDQDGDMDLLVAYGNDIQRGPIARFDNVDGELETEPSWTSVGLHFYGHIDVADLNGDGWPDLVASRYLGDGGFDTPGGVQVFLNQAGTLEGLPSWQAEGFYSFSSALGDMDGDGDLDLAVAVGEAYHNDPDYNRVYLNDGQGGFGDSPAWVSQIKAHSVDVGWADFNADGYLDLAFANISTAHCVYFGAPAGLSQSPGWCAEGDPTRFEGNSLDWGDINGDGALDLVISDNLQLGGAGTVSLYCGPALDRCWESADTPMYQSALAVEDIDGDGDLDLAAGAWGGVLPSGQDSLGAPVRIYLNQDGQWQDTPAWVSNTATVVEALVFVDIDGSHGIAVDLRGQGLVAIPRGRVLTVAGGVAHNGWLSGPGEVSATVLLPEQRDLAVSNWDIDIGNQLYGNTAP